MAEPIEKPFGHEPDGIAFRSVLTCAGVIALIVIAIAAGMHFVLNGAVMPNHAAMLTRPARIPPRPRLEAHPQLDLAQFRARKQALLSGYQWLGPGHHHARIPIQRAMQIYARQHTPVAAPAASSGAPALAPSSAKPTAQGARP
ncbi:MAG TPA: hypothetical protein VFW60_02220 [Rhodanobacteraceae bacterium]|nr:hypothetical protein [Rhodanobacteraceae bacterium]